jgi:hypothetical protein
MSGVTQQKTEEPSLRLPLTLGNSVESMQIKFKIKGANTNDYIKR